MALAVLPVLCPSDPLLILPPRSSMDAIAFHRLAENQPIIGPETQWLNSPKELFEQHDSARIRTSRNVLSKESSFVVSEKERGQQMQDTAINLQGLENDLCQQRLKKAIFQLDLHGSNVDTASFASLLQLCSKAKALTEGSQVHFHVVRRGQEGHRFLGNLLIEMYGKCGSLELARAIFEKVHHRNVFSWNIMIGAYAQHGDHHETLKLFRQMCIEGVEPSKFIFSLVLGACTNLENLAHGKAVHASVIEFGFESDTFIGTALVNMYGKCGSLGAAREAFTQMHQPNVVSWTAMIAAYAQHGHNKEALELLKKMQSEQVKPNEITFTSVLTSCANLNALEEGKTIHACIVDGGFVSDVILGNSLVNMYGKCSSLEDAYIVFHKMHCRDVVSWTALIVAYVENGQGKEALRLLKRIECEGLKPNTVTLVSALGACAIQIDLAEGKVIHGTIVEAGFESDVTVGNALVNMYGKCGSIEDAENVFNNLDFQDIISWNAIIAAHVQIDLGKDALCLFQEMIDAGIQPDTLTFISLLTGCAQSASLAEGKALHSAIIYEGLNLEAPLLNALINMYSKCASLDDSARVFEKASFQNVVSWNAIIAAYAQHGVGKDALTLFLQMQHECVKPDEITFVSILSACSHAGLVRDGCHYFVVMSVCHGIIPTREHYSCMVDLLGRAGQLQAAAELIDKMPLEPDVMAWESLLNASRIHGDVEQGIHMAKRVMRLFPHKSSLYICLSNLYAAGGE